MKKAMLTGFLALALAQAMPAQVPLFQNDGVINSPITIDAITFVNNGLFAIPVNANTTNLLVPQLSISFVNPTTTAYDFSDVQNYTNTSIMTSDTGFIFDTAPSSAGTRHAAANFVNQNPGTIYSGSSTSFFLTNVVFFVGVSPKLKIDSTNIVNTGALDVGVNGLMTISGRSVNLAHGNLHVEGFDNSVPFLSQSALGINLGILDLGIISTNWGIGRQTNVLSAANLNPLLVSSPGETVTNQTGSITGGVIEQLLLPNAQAFANVNAISQTNITYQFVFIADTVGQVATDVRFFPSGDFAVPIIRYASIFTNTFSGLPATNELFVSDSFGASTNLQLVTNILFTLNPAPSPVPVNYAIARLFAGYDTLPAGNSLYSSNLLTDAFPNGGAGTPTNDYTAMGTAVQVSSIAFDPFFPTQNITNIGGRLEITAQDSLDLTGALIGGPNYFKLSATNGHFIGSSNAVVEYPYGDIGLRSTNGLLTLTNITAPNLPRLNGPLELRSFRWTNLVRITVTNANGNTNNVTQTNRVHILMALSALNPLVAPKIKDLVLISTNNPGNLVISDIVNVTNTMLIKANSLTITSNAPGAKSTTGQLNLQNSNIIWSSSLSTNLLNLTNSGSINAANGIFFQKRLSPNFPSAGDGPYTSFVNHSAISTAGGSIIWANTFENTGKGASSATIQAVFGPVNVTAGTALMTNGSLLSPQGGMNLSVGSLTVSNHNLQVGNRLTVNATNTFTDGGSSNNVWTVGDGFWLPIKPATGDLLGTTITNTALNVPQQNVWAGQDRGISASGFLNDVAIGRLVLRGSGPNSVFHFVAAGASNAIYVDQIELAGTATNRVNNVFTGLNVDSNMTVYFADAVIGNLDISEKLDNANGGRFHWVSNYVGRFSSTNVTYPDAQTFQFNRALTASMTIDSDGDGTVNGADPTPFPEPFTAAAIALTINLTNQPVKAAVISWQAPSNSTNYLYYHTTLNTNWLVFTNFVQGPIGNRVTVIDPVLSGRLYKVRVDPAPQH